MAEITEGAQVSVKFGKNLQNMMTFGGVSAEAFVLAGNQLIGEDATKLLLGELADSILGGAAEFNQAVSAVQQGGLAPGAQQQPQQQAPGLSNQAPQGYQQQAQPDFTPRFCSHGQRTRYEGKNARGPYVAHFCPLEKGNPQQCKAEFE